MSSYIKEVGAALREVGFSKSEIDEEITGRRALMRKLLAKGDAKADVAMTRELTRKQNPYVSDCAIVPRLFEAAVAEDRESARGRDSDIASITTDEQFAQLIAARAGVTRSSVAKLDPKIIAAIRALIP